MKADLKLAIQTRIKQYRIDVGVCKETLEATLRRAQPGTAAAGGGAAASKAAAAASREELFSGAGGQGSDEHRINLTKSAEQRSRLAAATGRLEMSGERLKESRLRPPSPPPAPPKDPSPEIDLFDIVFIYLFERRPTFPQVRRVRLKESRPRPRQEPTPKIDQCQAKQNPRNNGLQRARRLPPPLRENGERA